MLYVVRGKVLWQTAIGLTEFTWINSGKKMRLLFKQNKQIYAVLRNEYDSVNGVRSSTQGRL